MKGLTLPPTTETVNLNQWAIPEGFVWVQRSGYGRESHIPHINNIMLLSSANKNNHMAYSKIDLYVPEKLRLQNNWFYITIWLAVSRIIKIVLWHNKQFHLSCSFTTNFSLKSYIGKWTRQIIKENPQRKNANKH